ncbi:MAG: 2-phospho-L-lactate guanylyltransferase [Actinomycetia bacterium]|nr:2-phospho-L-lactate guanylyltransferase [Actinomycetes bacterium]
MKGRQSHAVLVPVKAFADAKARLSSVLAPDQRKALARWTADRVMAAAGELPVYVACDDDEVAKWAVDRGAKVLWHPGAGLNGAVSRSVEQLGREGVTHVAVAHGDLPLAHDLAALILPDAITLVPDAHRDGTNVVAVSTALGFAFSYGAGSFQRHLALALASGQRTVVRRDQQLARDIDTPDDLLHPLVEEVLPAWLKTNPVSPTTRRR